MTAMLMICANMDYAAQTSLTQMRMRLKHLTQAELALAANVWTICAKIESTLFFWPRLNVDSEILRPFQNNLTFSCPSKHHSKIELPRDRVLLQFQTQMKA